MQGVQAEEDRIGEEGGQSVSDHLYTAGAARAGTLAVRGLFDTQGKKV